MDDSCGYEGGRLSEENLPNSPIERPFICASNLLTGRKIPYANPDLGQRTARKNMVVQVATSDHKGTPHIAAAKGMRIIGDEIVAFEDWLCLQTLRNIENNPKVAISLMEPGGESGYQLIGTIVKSVSNGNVGRLSSLGKAFPHP